MQLHLMLQNKTFESQISFKYKNSTIIQLTVNIKSLFYTMVNLHVEPMKVIGQKLFFHVT